MTRTYEVTIRLPEAVYRQVVAEQHWMAARSMLGIQASVPTVVLALIVRGLGRGTQSDAHAEN